MVLALSLFGYEVFSIALLRQSEEDSLSSVVLGTVAEHADGDPEFDPAFELPYGFIRP